MTTDSAGLRRDLAGRVTADCSAWRAAVEQVPREAFLGEAIFRQTGTMWEPVRRDQVGEAEWLRLAYQDRTWVTQIDGIDATEVDRPIGGSPTSSSTLPSLIIRMLEVAEVKAGDRVLEIGTGTGYSTAILCVVLGLDHVTSIECDERVATRASAALHDAGFTPNLVIGDGLSGYRPSAPYDALIATCAVRSIPFSWMAQIRAGGTITTTISGWMHASGLVRLTLAEDGSATGRFTSDEVSYMLARAHSEPRRPPFFRYDGTAREIRIDPAELETWTGRFVAQLAAPSAELMTTADATILLDVATGSQAWTEPAGNSPIVHQHGPLRLWDQVEDAIVTWHQADRRDQTAFGLTVTPEHEQRVWIDDPQGPSWPLPT